MKWKFIIVMVVALILSGCAKSKVDQNNDLGSGDKSNLPISLDLLIEHAEYCKAIYDSGGENKDKVHFEVKQDSGITIIIIRGTANTDNVQSDIDVRLVEDTRTGIRLHKGFRDASITIMQILDESYTIEHTVHVTGHSLGGAVAQIIGMWLHKRGNNVQIFSYGSPKVSNQVLPGGQPTHWRVVRLSDPIPFTPMWPYAHTGLFINSQTLDWGPDNDNGLISKTDGLDHAIAKYVTTLKEQR
ncbi:MAG: lipase family protein [Candidatus Pacebacteria bacterium]|nr:lipase family protein [Candidatus Paceibacterota bacterium]